jgi:hypothetical protein
MVDLSKENADIGDKDEDKRSKVDIHVLITTLKWYCLLFLAHKHPELDSDQPSTL